MELKLPVDPPLRSTDQPRIRIRGIYATALSKFFLDREYQIVQSSDLMKERLHLDETPLSPQIDIKTLYGKQGVKISCLSSHSEKIRSLFTNEFEDVIINQKEIGKGAVYKAIIHRPSPKGGYIVRLTPQYEAWLPPRAIRTENVNTGDITILEVKALDSEIGIPRVSRKINHPGDFAVLLAQPNEVKVSNKLSQEEQERLSGLGEILLPDEWGILWRTAARNIGIEELKREIDRLTEKATEFTASIEEAPSLTKLRNGFQSMEVSFPGMSKRKLDSTRRKVVPTVENHHQFKSLGMKYALLVDFTEDQLATILDPSKASDMLNEFLFSRCRRKGKELPIYHKKLKGREVILGPATVIESKTKENGWEYRTFRRFEAGGIYDGIEARQESGDIGVTFIEIGSEKLVTLYFDMREVLKGIYVNINSPIELYKNGVGYYDLEVDVVLTNEGDVKILDRKNLERLCNEGVISKSLVTWIEDKTKESRRWLEQHASEVVEEARRVIELAK